MITGAGRGFLHRTGSERTSGQAGREWCSAHDAGAYYNPLVRNCVRCRFPWSPRSTASPPAPAATSRSPAISCSPAARRTLCRLSPASGWCPIPAAAGFLPRLVGDARARALALMAEALPAEKAANWGLIWKCVDDSSLIAEAEKLCEHFASAPTQGLALIKRALDASATNTLDAQLDLERDLQGRAASAPDYAEGVRAFMEKRKPRISPAARGMTDGCRHARPRLRRRHVGGRLTSRALGIQLVSVEPGHAVLGMAVAAHGQLAQHLPRRLHLSLGRHRLRLRLQHPQSAHGGAALQHQLSQPGAARRPPHRACGRAPAPWRAPASTTSRSSATTAR